jgi:hypothetical protein
MMWIRRRFRNEEPAASGGVSRALKVMFEASSPLTGEDRGEGALIFCPLTLTLILAPLQIDIEEIMFM